jgi:RNA polymerase sigma factor (sigma-70 family)
MINNLKSFTRRYRGSLKREIAREVPIDRDGFALQLAARGSDSSARITDEEDVLRLRSHLERLPERDRLAVIWRSQDGLSYREIGDRLGCSSVAARKRWLRVTEKLRRQLSVSSSAHDAPISID